MRERAALMGGTFAMGPSPLGGTRVTVSVPAPPA
jgi:signal transduction histidine kinase